MNRMNESKGGEQSEKKEQEKRVIQAFLKDEKIIVEKFDFDLSSVILDLKRGDYKEAYPVQKTLLVFRQDDDQLDVSEINTFAVDFMDCCDGRATLQTI